jgi:hypothetical protein
MPETLTSTGARNDEPTAVPIELASDRNEETVASSAAVATIATAAFTAGDVTWLRMLTRKTRTISVARLAPKTVGRRTQSAACAA